MGMVKNRVIDKSGKLKAQSSNRIGDSSQNEPDQSQTTNDRPVSGIIQVRVQAMSICGNPVTVI